MIISNFSGGLGNQMFQYACAQALSFELGLPLRFCVDSYIHNHNHNGFELDRVFNVNLKYATDENLISLIGWRGKSIQLRHIVSKKYCQWLANRFFITEPYFNYWPDLVNKAINGAYIHGYWQSEKYFLKYSKQIRDCFTFRSTLNEFNRAIAKSITENISISVHVRRGDYISNAKNSAYHGFCGLDYYRTAINKMSNFFPNARFFVFSDDSNWVNQELKPIFPNLVLISNNKGSESHNDIRLMAMCSHHIIANSSFSWWGAWLNTDINKVVIAPKRWFLNKIDTSDLIPEDWYQI